MLTGVKQLLERHSLNVSKNFSFIFSSINNYVFAQRGGRSWGGSSQGQMDPSKAPKIGIVYGSVVDSASSNPVPYASISIVNARSSTIMTGGITNEKGEFYIKGNTPWSS